MASIFAATAAEVLQAAVAIAALLALPIAAAAYVFKRFINSIDKLTDAVRAMSDQQIRHDLEIKGLKSMEERHHADNQAILRQLARSSR
jgi:CBS domain containing-hemolysin-like protein